MKKMILGIITVALFFIVASPASAKCVGYTNVEHGSVYKYIDFDCNGSWDKVTKMRRDRHGHWKNTGRAWKCPRNKRHMHLHPRIKDRHRGDRRPNDRHRGDRRPDDRHRDDRRPHDRHHDDRYYDDKHHDDRHPDDRHHRR